MNYNDIIYYSIEERSAHLHNASMPRTRLYWNIYIKSTLKNDPTGNSLRMFWFFNIF